MTALSRFVYLFACLLVASLLSGNFAYAADPALSNLVGTWTVKSEGIVVLRGKDHGEKLHWKKDQTTLTAEAVFIAQQGRTFRGTFRSARAEEDFIGAIGHDGKTIKIVDNDGFLDGTMVDADTIEIVYRHATPKSSVISAGVWHRKK